MKNIKRIPASKGLAPWNVSFRKSNTGVIVDIQFIKENLTNYDVHKCAYLIPLEQIKAWAKLEP